MALGNKEFGEEPFGGRTRASLPRPDPLPDDVFPPPCPGCTTVSEAEFPLVFDAGILAFGQFSGEGIGDLFMGDTMLGDSQPRYIEAFDATLEGKY